MRYIRQTVPLRQNKQNAILNEKEKEKMEELKLEVKSAYTQVNMLKETNKKLLWKIEMMEKQMQGQLQIKEELEFLREQEDRYKQQLTNYDDINRKLREELEKTEKEKNQFKEKLRFMALEEVSKASSVLQSDRSEQVTNQPNPRIQEYKSLKFPREGSSRTSICMSIGTDRSRQNHHSTPKSKLKINIEQLIPQTLNNRRKVFL